MGEVGGIAPLLVLEIAYDATDLDLISNLRLSPMYGCGAGFGSLPGNFCWWGYLES